MTHDRKHRLQNDIKRSTRDASLYWVCQDTCLAYTCRRGPWQGASLFQVLRDLFMGHYRRNDYKCPLL